MKDMLDIVYDGLIASETIKEECSGRIKFYFYPETADTTKPFITIRPTKAPTETNFASNKSLSYEFAYQVDVQSYDRKKCKLIQNEVKKALETLGFSQQNNDGLDEYFEETKRFVDARRYFITTNLHDTDY